ncbi:MAG TPA: zf-HC2 domain-containing protein [Pyrinomonadaceae bacterium]|nr:zf-HC2 domain-containing protein [Pyrinomonadaceae bacterium]
MNCNYTEKVSSLIDGELTQAETREVERHLLNCAECQQMRADFLNLRSQIVNFETSLQPTVQNRALKKILSAQRRAPALGLQWGFGKAVAFASLLITGVILGLLLYQSSNSTGPQSELNAGVQTPSPVPTATIEQAKQAATPEQSPQPSPGQEQSAPTKDDKEPPRKAPAPKRIVREPKPHEQFASIPEPVRSADAETMTALHFEKSETLLRSFRNVRLNEPGSVAEVSYERQRAQQLVYQNMMLRREADARGDVQVASLLESLEPILLDISNLPDKPNKDAVRVIRERVERKNIVPLLRVNSTALARALD